MRKFIAIYFLIFSFLLDSKNILSQWVQCDGVYGGVILCIAYNGNFAFAGSEKGGLFISSNYGSNWYQSSLATQRIKTVISDGSIIYAGANDGIYVSTNNGSNWNHTFSGSSIYCLTSLGNYVFAGRSGNFYYSTNNGSNWLQGNFSYPFYSLATLGTTIFAGAGTYGTYKSTNYGHNWSQVSSFTDVISFGVSGTTIFAGTSNTYGTGTIYVSTNSGVNWTGTSLTDRETRYLAVNGNNAFAGTINYGAYRTTNYGASWIQTSLNSLSVYSIAILPNNDIIAGYNFGGVYKSTNNGTNWIQTNINAAWVNALACASNYIFAGTYIGTGVYLSTNNGTNWTQTTLNNKYITSIVVNENNIFAATSNQASGTGGVFRSTNNGNSWTQTGSELGSIYSLLISGNNIFAGTPNGIYISSNNGTNWLQSSLNNKTIYSIGSSGNNIFAGANDGIYLSSNNGQNWIQTSFGNLTVRTIASNSNFIFAGADNIPYGSGGVYYSSNFGNSWSNTGLTNRSVKKLLTMGYYIFAGTDSNGVIFSSDNGINWNEINNGFNLIPSISTMLLVNNNLFVGINSQSIWKRSLSNLNFLFPPSNLNYNAEYNRITWDLSPSSNVSKYLVYKKGTDNIWKSVSDSGGMVSSTQDYYNIQTSGYNFYKVAAISNTGDTAECDSVYVNRGYVLRNWNSGILEAFKVNKNGFNFGNHDTLPNGEPLLWNSFWYSQFNYQNPPYPYYFRLFSKSADYPDWPLFTNVYGHNKCYIYYFKPGNILDSSFIRRSVARWSNIKYCPVVSGKRPIETWRGACFGFSLSSLLAFYKNTSFYNQFPVMNNVDSAYGLLPSTAVKNMINHLQQTQNFNGPILKYQDPPDSINQNPVYVLNLLEYKFSKISTLGRLNEILAIYYNNGGGHAVVPYAIEKLNESVKLLYIYDNEYPANDNLRLVINTTTNFCYHSQNNRVINRMLLAGSLDSYLGEQSDFKSLYGLNYSRKNTNDSMIIYNASNSSSFYINKNGDTISGFRITDNTYIGNKNLAFSQITDGRANPPLYYKIPNSDYIKIVFNNFVSNNQISFVSLDIDSSTTYKIERIDSTQVNQNDLYFLDSSKLSFTNNNPLQKKINIMTILTQNYGSKNEKTFEIDNFKMINNDSVFVNKENTDLVIKSEGSSKIYCLRLNYLDPSGNKTFYNPNVYLTSNTTHIISPDWDSIKTKPVKIYVDLGNNGTIDDTLYISDTVLIKIKNISNEIPNKFILYQNYPNPFNPITNIKYDLPKDAFVIFKVYDIIGRKIMTLINDYKKAGSYNLTFDGTNFASGIYFYKINAGDFVHVKRMVLLK